jgi:excisionase family DNA binding protein
MTTTTQYLTLGQAAKHFQVSLSTFRNWVHKGIVPKTAYIRLGSVYRFNLVAVEEALKAQSTHEGEDE